MKEAESKCFIITFQIMSGTCLPQSWLYSAMAVVSHGTAQLSTRAENEDRILTSSEAEQGEEVLDCAHVLC